MDAKNKISSLLHYFDEIETERRITVAWCGVMKVGFGEVSNIYVLSGSHAFLLVDSITLNLVNHTLCLLPRDRRKSFCGAKPLLHFYMN